MIQRKELDLERSETEKGVRQGEELDSERS